MGGLARERAHGEDPLRRLGVTHRRKNGGRRVGDRQPGGLRAGGERRDRAAPPAASWSTYRPVIDPGRCAIASRTTCGPSARNSPRRARSRAPGQRGDRPYPLGSRVGQHLVTPTLVLGAVGDPQAAPAAWAGTFSRAISTSAVNAAGSLTARSASILRSTSTSAALSPWINRL